MAEIKASESLLPFNFAFKKADVAEVACFKLVPVKPNVSFKVLLTCVPTAPDIPPVNAAVTRLFPVTAA